MSKKKVYLDYASTTPLDPRVFAAMKPYFSMKFGNPMSIHSFGRTASKGVENARAKAADFFGCNPEEVIFTSGATESNNLAIRGPIEALKRAHKGKLIPHIITTRIEHSCILETCRSLERQKMAEVTFLETGREGVVDLSSLKRAIKKNTVLVSVMYVNNEIGTIQPIKEIGLWIKKVNEKRSRNNDKKIIFHTDAVQAVNYLNCKVNNLCVDLLTASAHKIYGPKGIGCLYIRKNISLSRIQQGGGHEFGLRAGTLNVPGIVGMGEALEIADRERMKNQKIAEMLRNHLVAQVLKLVKGSSLNGSKIKRIANNANFTFSNVEGEGLLLGLDMKGIAASTGSACSSGDLKPSHVLEAIRLSDEESHGSLRVTLGKYTTKKEVDYFIGSLSEVISRLRKIAGE